MLIGTNIEKILEPTKVERFVPVVGGLKYLFRARNEILRRRQTITKEEGQIVEKIYRGNLREVGAMNILISAVLIASYRVIENYF